MSFCYTGLNGVALSALSIVVLQIVSKTMSASTTIDISQIDSSPHSSASQNDLLTVYSLVNVHSVTTHGHKQTRAWHLTKMYL